jgi:hypothetical protein
LNPADSGIEIEKISDFIFSGLTGSTGQPKTLFHIFELGSN